MDLLQPGGVFCARGAHGEIPPRKDALIANEIGDNRISLEDYAVALVDELERPAHIGSRFTIGY